MNATRNPVPPTAPVSTNRRAAARPGTVSRLARFVAVVTAVLVAGAGCHAAAPERSGPQRSPGELGAGGTAPAQQVDGIVRSALKDVERYWKATLPRVSGGRQFEPVRGGYHPYTRSDPPPACGPQPGEYQPNAFYCPSGDYVAFDNRTLAPALYQHIGDNAVGMLLADLFAQAAQDRRGRSAQGRNGQLAVDCLAGSWANDLLSRGPDSQLRLSPGDLDEAVAALLVFGRAAGSDDASAFDRIGAFRNGVLTGLRACG